MPGRSARWVSFGCMALIYGGMAAFAIWLVINLARAFLSDWRGSLTVLGVVIAIGVGLALLGGLWWFVSSERVTSWVRRRVVTAGWMSLLFGGLIIGPSFLPEPVKSAYEPWRLLVVPVLGGLLYWFKHPAAWEKGLLIACLVWLGFHAELVVPGLAAYEAAQQREGAYSAENCYDSQDSIGIDTEVCPTRPSSYLGIPLLGIALYVATGLGAKRTQEERVSA